MRLRVIKQVSATAFREFMRTPEAVFWTYGFPLVMAVVLGLAFGEGEPAPIRIAVPEQAEHAAALDRVLAGNPRLETTTLPAAELERARARGEIDLVVRGSVADPVFELDPTVPGAELARLHALNAFRTDAGQPEPPAEVVTVTAPGSRYIDFLIPGLISLNLLGAGIWGIGYNFVNMRVRKLLRRLAVTPMKRSEFLLSYILSRLVLVVPESLAITLFGVLAFGVPVNGSVFALFVLVVIGGLTFSGLGVLIASRPQTIEGVSGIMNLVMLPMWLLGGSFFSAARFPDYMQPLVMALPLTHLNDALRAVMLGGEGLLDVAGHAAYVVGFGVACFLIAVRAFRWS